MTTPSFNRPKNTTYWLRCLRTLLPTDYTANDLSRTSLAFFCISALDVLGHLGTITTTLERTGWIDWIYHCQHPIAGFRGSPATDLAHTRNAENARWDPGNLAATFFALVTLLALGDGLERVRRREILMWVKGLQRQDGSFKDMDESDEESDGLSVRDTRFVYFAASIRWILRGKGRGLEGVDDINVDGAVEYIKSTECYDHGYAAAPHLEAHAGLTFCAIAALELLGRLNATSTPNNLLHSEETLHWLISRQNAIDSSLSDDEDEDDEYDDDPSPPHPPAPEPAFPPSTHHNGFNGRCNKKTDTCYSFWVIGTLDLLKKSHLVDAASNRAFLLEKTAHLIGGFGKNPGSPPDVLHSYLALAALSIFREQGLNRIDSALCITLQAKERLEGRDWWRDS